MIVGTQEASGGVGRHLLTDSRAARSFRQPFLVSYGIRIGERLADAAEVVEKDVVGAELVPVLIADRERVDRAREELFPETVARSVAVSSYQGGYAAGAGSRRSGPAG